MHDRLKTVVFVAVALWIVALAMYRYASQKPQSETKAGVAAFFILVGAVMCSLAALAMFVGERFPDR